MTGLLTGTVLLLAMSEGQAVQPSATVETAAPTTAVAPGVTGRLERREKFASRYVDPRNVDVWLPPGYAQDDARRFPVVYMHDGQNLFDPATAYAGIDWGIDETMTRLIGEGVIRAAIVVGVWNTSKRFAEYMPRKALSDKKPFVVTTSMEKLPREQVVSDDYLRFLVEELKPFIDSTYRTLPDRANTTIMGSSMGGLISVYALAEYPDVFGGAGGISTHWLIGEGIVIDYLEKHLPDPPGHLVYFDFGTATLDQYYEPYQRRMDAVMRRSGYREGQDWITRKYEGAEHNETAWRARVDVPLTFFLRR
jgi:predicted alpha/beta superfamily hydrolase